MKDNIIQIFDGIDKKELKSLYDFVNSPFFNKSKRLSDFYELIYKNFDVYKANGLAKKDLAKKLYPGETYSKKTDENIRKLLSDFGKLLDSYLVTTKFLEDEDNPALTLVKTLRERGIEDKFKKKLSDLKKKQEKVSYRDEKYYKLESELIEEELELEFTKKMLRYSETDQRASDYTDWNFIINKLRYFLRMWTKQFYNKETLPYKWGFYEHIKKFINDNKIKISSDHPEIYIQYLITIMFNEDNEDSVETLRNYLKDNKEVFPDTVYTYYSWKLINYLVLQVNNGKLNCRKEVLEITKGLDKDNLLLKNNVLLPNEFKMCVDFAFAEKEFQWVEYFINKYKGKIQKEFAKSLVNLSLARLYFFKDEYSKAKLLLLKVDYKDYIHYCDAKMLLARIDFETGDFNALSGTIETLKKFLKSHTELPEIYHKIYNLSINNIVLLRKIYEGKMLKNDISFEYKELTNLLKNSKNHIYAKNWFIEKLEQIKKPELSPRL